MAVVVVWLVIAVARHRRGAAHLEARLGALPAASDAGPTVPTDEVLVDPETGRRQRVHMNPATGARIYVDEPGPPGGPGGG